MKKKLKKLGVLAVLLANVTIFAPQKVEAQIEIDISDPSNGNNRHWVEYTIFGIKFYGCVNGGNECLDDIVVTP
ncbi:hypothetical protein [Raineya orbicola]|uniref:Uncharacterized protein n=1 Tax=Raineya orbicola TaxID=2016530 RepID=A0A2N3I8Y3_9BACT|nr:hypothetical protein [Raineya orbicola]PKQ66750.1 hypothetical protein Rain11_2279 [Raineya orbicola]